MKQTKILLGSLLTFLITWLIVATIVYLLSNYTFKQSFIAEGGVIFFMFALGWIPALFVGLDLEKEL